MRYSSIQYLRGVAAIAVVLYHLVDVQWPKLGFEGPWSQRLLAGVDLFFVVSGFIMWQTTEGGSLTPRQFLARRALRVVPLYWVFTTLLVAVALLAPRLLQSTRFDLGHVVASYLFLPHTNPADGQITPILVPGWTLNYEAFFYVIFAFGLWLPIAGRLGYLCSVLIGITVVGALTQPASAALLFYTSPLMLEFLFGVLIAVALGRAGRHSPGLGATLVVLGAAALALAPLAWPSQLRFLVLGLPCTVIVAGAVLLERALRERPNRVALLLGDASYAIYLAHGIVLSACSQLWRSAAGDTGVVGLVVFSAGSVICSVVAGTLIHRWLEKPMTDALQAQAIDLAGVAAPTAR